MITDTTPVQFLAMVRPPPWTLVAINPVYGKGIETRTFTELPEAAEWIAEWDRRWNLYIHVARLWPGHPPTKGRREHVAAITHYHADVDVKPATPAKLAAKLKSVLAHDPSPPTLGVMSGGGFNFWYELTTPIMAPPGSRNDPDLWRDLERRNWQLEHDLSDHPDGTWDACRILRIAGTWNCLSDKKRSEGREECQAELWFRNDVTFTPDQFTEGPEGCTAGKGSVSISDLPDDLPVVDVDSLPLDGRWKSIIILGYDVLQPDKYRSGRSGTVFALTMAMCCKGIDDVTIASVLLNPGNGISEHVLKQGGCREYAAKQIANARGRINDHRS